jgi:hypothetical protein
MFATRYGTYIAFIYQPCIGSGLSIFISFSDDCIQLLVSEIHVLFWQISSLIFTTTCSYSTCLGKADASKRDFVKKDDLKYGMDMLDIPPDILRLMEEHINGKWPGHFTATDQPSC